MQETWHLRMVEISDKHFLFCLSISEILFVISDFIFFKCSIDVFEISFNVRIAMETKRTDFDNIWQDVNKVKKYASDLQTFIGVNDMTSVVDGEVKKQNGAFDYDIFELKIPENRTISFSYFPLFENINNRLPSCSANTHLPSGNMSQPFIRTSRLTSVWMEKLRNRMGHSIMTFLN
jgi:hypothetical protein